MKIIPEQRFKRNKIPGMERNINAKLPNNFYEDLLIFENKLNYDNSLDIINELSSLYKVI